MYGRRRLQLTINGLIWSTIGVFCNVYIFVYSSLHYTNTHIHTTRPPATQFRKCVSATLRPQFRKPLTSTMRPVEKAESLTLDRNSRKCTISIIPSVSPTVWLIPLVVPPSYCNSLTTRNFDLIYKVCHWKNIRKSNNHQLVVASQISNEITSVLKSYSA